MLSATGPNIASTPAVNVNVDAAVTGPAFIVADPLLGPLQNNGGFTPTLLPQPGSPAIDAGDGTTAAAAGLTTDQRGPGFARVYNGTVDIGATEAQPAAYRYTPPAGPILVGGPLNGTARLLTVANGTVSLGDTVTFFPGLGADVRTAVADVNGDGTPDYIGGSGPGVTTRVVVKDGATGNILADFQPFENGFTGGVYLAAGDFDRDGKADLVVTPDEGGGAHVLVYTGASLTGGTSTPVKMAEYNGLADLGGAADDTFRGGIRAAVGDVTGDGVPDLVIAAGFGGGPRITLWDGAQVAAAGGGKPKGNPVANFFAFEDTLRNGAFAAVGDVTGDGRADLIFGGGPGGGPRVRAADGSKLVGYSGSLDAPSAAGFTVANFYAGDPNTSGGVRLAVKNIDGDGLADVIAGSGDGQASAVRVYTGAAVKANPNAPVAAQDPLDPFGQVLANGVFVG